jgi:hypothetical protein
MPDESPTAAPVAPEVPPPPFAFRGTANSGNIHTDGGTIVGTYTHDTIELDLGWCWVAGLNVVIRDNPRVDNHRGGVAFARKVSA